ncbi:MAG TPA: radical SAM protein [Anaerolineales bacterium]|nr:radical SAM protein [Anaerolineales bacterium]
MTQILLGQSYYLRFDPKLWEAMQPYPPLGTLYAASWLRQHGYNVALFDAMLAESEDEWASALDEHKPRYAIIYEDNFNYLSKMCLLRMRDAAFKMIHMAKSRGCVVILCGADATDHSAEYLERGADYCLLGEGEETLLELLNQLEGQKDARLKSILGLAYQSPVRRTDGSSFAHRVEVSNLQSPVSSLQFSNSPILSNPRRPDITNLDKLPFPAWDLVDIQKYKNIWLKHHGYFSMNMVTTRGCPYHCNWCAKPIWGQRYNSRSPENVAAEMKWIKETFAPDHIWFADDILGLKPNWIEKFAALLNEADAVIPFKCLQRADLVNEKTAPALAKAGCKTVWLGAESGSQKILDAMDKGDSVDDIYNAARLLKANRIEVGFFLQFGYPDETWGDVQKTLKMVRECAPDDIGISVSYPLPGTKFYERVKLELGEKQNWVDSEDLAMLYRGPFPTEFYRVLHGRVHYEFRAWKALRRPSARGVFSVPKNLFGLLRSEWRLRRFISRLDHITDH